MHAASLEMNVSCSQCSTRYAIPDEKVRGRKFRLPCRRCGHSIIIDARDLPAGPAHGRSQSSSRVSRSGGTSVRGGKPPWSVSIDGSVREMSLSQLAAGFQQGRIPPQAYVWRSGMAAWTKLHEAHELIEAMASIGVDVSGLGAPRDAPKGQIVDLADATTGLDSDKTQVTGPPSSALPLGMSDATLADALPDDGQEATVMVSPPAPPLSDALPDDEDEATSLYSPSAHGAVPGGAPEPASAEGPPGSGGIAPGSPGRKDAPARIGNEALSDALPDDEDEATSLFSPSAHGSAVQMGQGGAAHGRTGRDATESVTELADALGDEDEATRLVDVDKGDRDKPTANEPSKGMPASDGGRDPSSSRPPARAESAAPVVPPRATDSASDWSESSVVVSADAPDENLARVPDRIGLEQADERTDKTKAGRHKRSGTGSIVTVVLVIVLVIAAGTAGYLISQRGEPHPQGSAGFTGRGMQPGEQPERGGAEPLVLDKGTLGRGNPQLGETPSGAGSNTGRALEADSTGDESPSEASDRTKQRANRVLGRAERPAEKPAPRRGGDDRDPPPEAEAEADDTDPSPSPLPPFDAAAAKATLLARARAAEAECSRPGEPNGSSIVSLTLATTGKAMGISVRGPLTGTTTALCIMKKFSKVTVPAFSGDPVPMQHTVRIP